jgi:hypothetical protein
MGRLSLVATQSGVASTGSRRTRREHRSRKRQAQLRKSIRAMPRHSAFTVLSTVISVIEVIGRGLRRGLLWGVIVLLTLLLFMAEKGRSRLASPSRSVLDGVRQAAEKGFGRDKVLFIAFLGSGLAAMAYVTMGKASLAMLCCLLAVLMGIVLLIGDKRECAVTAGDTNTSKDGLVGDRD